ncbi:MAG: crossover junction endodeoxyribonuclease RuvC [Chloroflexi bacterium]|nr:crossover junction endodeoxyribonuclease RuvC [Chloroflexota bacterium]
MHQRVLGIDPGTIRMGYGVLETAAGHTQMLTNGVLKASRSLALGERLLCLHEGLAKLLNQWTPVAVAIEEPYVPRNEGSGTGYKTSARSAIAIGQAQAIALIAAAAAGIPVYGYAPSQVKQAVSAHGRGSKEQVQEMVRLLLGLDSRPEPSDAADALAVALCHLRYQQVEAIVATGAEGGTR